MTIEKPPYRVPLVSEINAMTGHGRTVASLFSGGGGSSTGYRIAGFDVRWANEFIGSARETYRANWPTTIMNATDIRDLSPADVLAELGMGEGELDLLDGSPPCASFSTSGKRDQYWGKAKAYSERTQRTDDLFFEYARILRGVQPKVFVAENVSGLVKGVSKGYFIRIHQELRACGYRVEARLLDAQWLGVPQARQRIFFIGVRNDLGLNPVFPTPLPYRYSVRDAINIRVIHDTSGTWSHGDVTNEPCPTITVGIGRFNGHHYQVVEERPPGTREDGGTPSEVVGLEGANGYDNHAYRSADEPAATVQASRALDCVERPVIGVGTHDGVRSADEPAPTVLTHGRGQTHSELSAIIEPESSIDGYAIAEEWDSLRPGEQSARYLNLVRPHPDRPSNTVTAVGGTRGSTASVTHPFARRKFSIAELKRICSFPDDYILTGTYAQQWERCGRAVPPLMMAAIAAAIRDGVFARL